VSTETLVDQLRSETSTPRWNLATRIAFRFCCVYFVLYCLSTQILTSLFAFPSIDIPDPSSVPPLRQMIAWTATHIFRVSHPLVFTGSGSGDKIVDYVLCFCLLGIALAVTALWSAKDRRPSHPRLCKAFRVFLRFALASQMFVYGFDKAFPLQMPFPRLFTLVEPFGNFSSMGVLWSSVGASQPYEIAVGCAEILGGLLLILPQTTTLGALVSLADVTYVFLLNMTYDVPVKLFSLHLILICLILLAPEARRFADFFLFNRPVAPAPGASLFRSRRARRVGLAAQILFGLWLISLNLYGVRESWKSYGPGAPVSPLYGIWNVEQFTLDGQAHPPLLTDNDRWHRIIFDYPKVMVLDRMNDARSYFQSTIDSAKHTLALASRADPKAKSSFTFSRPTPDQLILDGTLDGRPAHMQLRLVDAHKFQLESRGFHWIQEYPYNR
jgi:uncharacterized membrane protein YphA (DoxX/SURF4 family)